MQRSKLHGPLHFCVLSLRTTIFESQIYQMLINSNQLVGAGSVSMPENITAGVNPHKSNVFVFWNIKLMSNILVSIIGDLTMLNTPFDFLLCGTGMAVWRSEKEKNRKSWFENSLWTDGVLKNGASSTPKKTPSDLWRTSLLTFFWL